MGRRRYKKKNGIEGLFDVFYALTGHIWPIGAGVTGFLAFFSYLAYDWAEIWRLQVEQSRLFASLATHLGWAVYLPSVMLAALAVLFALKTWKTYCDPHRF